MYTNTQIKTKEKKVVKKKRKERKIIKRTKGAKNDKSERVYKYYTDFH